MVLHDRLAADPTWNLRVLATDLSEEMVRRTRAGRYSQLEINRGLPAAKLVRTSPGPAPIGWSTSRCGGWSRPGS
jgi:chemotaxis methyl-accepting protein methylase